MIFVAVIKRTDTTSTTTATTKYRTNKNQQQLSLERQISSLRTSAVRVREHK